MNKKMFVLAMSLNTLLIAQTFEVLNYKDEGVNSFRWAINQLNKSSSSENEIIVNAVGEEPYVITINKPLPKINKSVKIIAKTYEEAGKFIKITPSYIKQDTKSCVGANKTHYGTNVRTMDKPGLFLQNADKITLKGFEISGFCIGILINKSSNNIISNNIISNNFGGAGIMITADDGKGNPTDTTTNNNWILDNIFINNGDGLELTRGAAFNFIQNNIFTTTKSNQEPSQGIEILWGNNNYVVGNKFENYSDGLQINWGNNNHILYNEFFNNSLGLNLSGDKNMISKNKIHNNKIAIAIRSSKDENATIKLSQNSIFNNGKNINRCFAGGYCGDIEKFDTAIAFSVPGLEHKDFIGNRGGGVVIEEKNLQITCNNDIVKRCNQIPNQNIKAPKLSFKNDMLNILIQDKPNGFYVVEIFTNDEDNKNQAQYFLTQTSLMTDKNGSGQTNIKLSGMKKYITATLTDNNGATSKLSNAVTVR